MSELEQQLIDRCQKIEAWFRRNLNQYSEHMPFYCSADLRNAAFKVAPVDLNLFPAGFNNLNPAFNPLCASAAKHAVGAIDPAIDRILVIPEDHTRNLHYLENIASLCRILEQAGFSVAIGSLAATEAGQAAELQTASEHGLLLQPLQRQGDKLALADFVPDMVLLNNDLSSGVPDILQNLAQPVRPQPAMGWGHRSKANYFRCYGQLLQQFCDAIEFSDPWLLQPLSYDCGNIDFMQHQGVDCLEQRVSDLLQQIQAKYRQYGVDSEPFVVIKADTGTYGMAVMMIRSVQEVRELNRKQRSHMAKIKGGRVVQRVIIQEGVSTCETWGEAAAVAEPVVYLIGGQVVGGFYRVHGQKGQKDNLNSPGMHFEPLAFAECCLPPISQEEHCNRFYMYGVLGRLAALAAAYEAKQLPLQ
ncbi:MAG: glutamate--cysteine ligase [Candidatus Porifericomitaceae bacterium WSBS_2022_MAG_OTU9]